MTKEYCADCGSMFERPALFEGLCIDCILAKHDVRHKASSGYNVNQILAWAFIFAAIALMVTSCTEQERIIDKRIYGGHFAYNDFVAKDQESLRK